MFQSEAGMQNHTPCRRYLCRAISPVARGGMAPVPLCAFPLCELLLPPQPALQHWPTGAQTAWQMWGAMGEQGVFPLRWSELEEGSGRVGSRWVGRGKRGGSRGGRGGGTVWAAGDGRHRACRVGRWEVLAAAVGHGGQWREGRSGGSGRAPASHGQGDPLRGDGVDLRGHGAARWAREGQRGGCQAIAIELFVINRTAWTEEKKASEKRGGDQKNKRKINERWDFTRKKLRLVSW